MFNTPVKLKIFYKPNKLMLRIVTSQRTQILEPKYWEISKRLLIVALCFISVFQTLHFGSGCILNACQNRPWDRCLHCIGQVVQYFSKRYNQTAIFSLFKKPIPINLLS